MDTWAKVGFILTAGGASTSKAAVCSRELSPLCVADRSPHNTQRSPIHSVTSAVEVGRSMRSPEADCHSGPCPSRARYSRTRSRPCVHPNVLNGLPVGSILLNL